MAPQLRCDPAKACSERVAVGLPLQIARQEGVEKEECRLVRMARDRYVARRAGDVQGTLQTPPVIVEGSRVTLNVDAGRGEVRMQLLNPDGQPIEGFTLADCEPIKADALTAPVRWRGRLESIKGRPVRLAFSLKRASLFAFDVRE